MTRNNLKQAYFPEGCRIIRNRNGTAPGCIIEEEGRTIVLLPGPPSELKPMFEETVMPYLASKADHRLESVYVRIFGIGEAEVETALMDLIDGQTNPTIASYAKDGEVMLRITARYQKDGTGTGLIGPMVDEIRKRLGDAVFSTDNSSLAEVAAKLLMEKKMTISLAESARAASGRKAYRYTRHFRGFRPFGSDIQQPGQGGRTRREAGNAGEVRGCQ